jgi:hypothetical protein
MSVAYARVSEQADRVKAATPAASGLRIGDPDDAFEREADRVADQVMTAGRGKPRWSLSTMGVWPGVQRKCDCGKSAGAGGECEECKEKGALQRASLSSRGSETAVGARAPPIVHDVLRSSGQPLDLRTREFMEHRFGTDFGKVRVHSDAKAAESARSVNALGYTVGADVVLDPRRCDPASPDGLRILAHELAHVVQQRGHQAPGATSIVETPRLASQGSPALMRLTPNKFRSDLGATRDEKTAIDALFSQAQFKALWDYMAACKATPKKDLGPLGLKVTPGLKIGGVERFGGYSPGQHTLEINPTKPEHTANPQELVDTIVHELIHAVDDLEASCKSAGSPASPLAGAGTDQSAPPLANVRGSPAEDKLLRELGPGASNPCEEFIDVNKQAQQIIVSIIQSDINTTKIGHPTLTFVNDALRQDPQALADYKGCRDSACANPDPAARKAAIGRCSEMIIMKYVTPLPVVPQGSAVAAQDAAGDRDATRAV